MAIGAALGIGAGLASGIVPGIIGAGGARQAGDAAGAAGWQARENALQQAGANKSLASPYLIGGYAGTNALLKSLGLGHLNPMNVDGGPMSTAYGETSLNTDSVDLDRTNALRDFRASPGYNWRVGQGVKALDQSAASRGMVQSGAQKQAVTDFGQEQGSNEWSNHIKNLFALSGQGAGSASGVNNANTSAMNNGNNALFGGQLEQASSYSNAANALASGINKGVQNAGALVGRNPWQIFGNI
jgi:hypothetical protein